MRAASCEQVRLLSVQLAYEQDKDGDGQIWNAIIVAQESEIQKKKTKTFVFYLALCPSA